MHGGIEWLVDSHGCAPARLRDRAAVVGVLDRVVAEMRLHVVSTAVHVFPGEGGITAMYLLAESHLAIHTFPETGVATLNAYCCTQRAAPRWQPLLAESLGAREVRVTEVTRGGPVSEANDSVQPSASRGEQLGAPGSRPGAPS